MTRIGSASFTAVTSPVVSSSSTTVPFCGVLWLKSNMLPSVPDAVEGATADAFTRKESIFDKPHDGSLVGQG
jgi:hypothetical protein